MSLAIWKHRHHPKFFTKRHHETYQGVKWVRQLAKPSLRGGRRPVVIDWTLNRKEYCSHQRDFDNDSNV
jgi:hypothetical protein